MTLSSSLAHIFQYMKVIYMTITTFHIIHFHHPLSLRNAASIGFGFVEYCGWMPYQRPRNLPAESYRIHGDEANVSKWVFYVVSRSWGTYHC